MIVGMIRKKHRRCIGLLLIKGNYRVVLTDILLGIDNQKYRHHKGFTEAVIE
jgi:hypothetical protein